MHKKVLKTTPSLFLRTLLRTVTRFLFFSLGKKKVGGKLTVSANRYHHSVAKTEHSHPLGMVVSTHFRCGKGVKRGLKNGALPFNID